MKKRKLPFLKKQPESRLSPRSIAFIYAVVGGLWILASDRVVALIGIDPDRITDLQTYKGWFYVIMTALMLYGLVRLYGNKLIDSTRRTTEILESISDGFFALDEQMVVIYCNKAAERLLGRKSADLLGRRLFEVFPEENITVFEEQYTRALKEKSSITFETCYGTEPYENWYDIRIYPLAQGAAIYFQVITERKKAEAALRESQRQESLLADLLERSSQPFAIRYPDARLGRVNTAFSELTGYGKDELLAIDVSVLTPPEWQDVERQKLEELTETGYPVRYKKEYIRKNGSRIPVEVLAHIVRNEQGGARYYYAFVTDITERKLAEEIILKERDFSNAALDSLPGIVYLFDREGRFLRWNRKFEQMSEYSFEEIGRMNPLDFFIEPDKKFIHQRIRETFEKGSSHGEADLMTKSGKHMPYYFTGRIIQAEGKQCLIGMGIDITERKRTDEALRRREEHFRRLTEQSPVPIAISNDRGEIEYVNEQFVRTFGYERKDIPTIDAWFVRAYPDPGYRMEVITIWEQAVKSAIERHSVIEPREYRVRCKDGTTRTVEIFGSLIGGAEQVIFNDVTDRKKAEEKIKESSERFKNLVEASSDWVWETDENAVYTYASPKVRDILGYEPEEVLGRTPLDLMAPEERERCSVLFNDIAASQKPFSLLENVNLHKNGNRVVLETSGVPIFDNAGRMKGYRGIDRDITERKRAEDTIRYQAYHDLLTGLPNRTLFTDLLDHEILEMQRIGKRLAVLFLDVDQFKNVNDSFGHAAGDALIRQISAQLKNSIRDLDTIARIGGDEFTLLLPLMHRAEDASRIADKVMQTFSKPFRIDHHEIRLTASIGISLYPEDGQDAGALLKNADIALHFAKDQGRDNYQFYNASISHRTLEKVMFENRLRQAVERGELVVHYQPQRNIKTGKITGAEALVRWNHPDLGTLGPAQFIHLAEETGLIIEIDQWVLGTVCNQLKAWERAGHALPFVTANLSARQFQQPALAEMIGEILKRAGLMPGNLGIEITETLAMQDTELTSRNLNLLNAMGVKLLIDDFGTGYSSLSYLKKLPIHKLKIDKSFITDLAIDRDDQAITNAIVAMAHILKLKVVAEGVETKGQESLLESQDCDEMQGFLFSKPMPAEEFEKLLA